MTTLSTPPASQAGTPTHNPEIYSQMVQRDCSIPQEHEAAVHEPCSPNTATNITNTLPDTLENNHKTKRPRKRASKTPAPRSTLHCKHCTKSFSKQSKLQEHENAHERTTAVCPEPRCNKAYGRQADLARHQRSVRTAKGRCPLLESLTNYSIIKVTDFPASIAPRHSTGVTLREGMCEQ